MERIARTWPDTPVCLFLGAHPASTVSRARRSKGRYVALGPTNFVPLVAVLWPRQKAIEFLDWAHVHARKMTRADDGNAGRWVRDTRQQVMVTVPSLVQHNDDEPSVKGGREHVPWRESWRQAVMLAEDASEYEW